MIIYIYSIGTGDTHYWYSKLSPHIHILDADVLATTATVVNPGQSTLLTVLEPFKKWWLNLLSKSHINCLLHIKSFINYFTSTKHFMPVCLSMPSQSLYKCITCIRGIFSQYRQWSKKSIHSRSLDNMFLNEIFKIFLN